MLVRTCHTTTTPAIPLWDALRRTADTTARARATATYRLPLRQHRDMTWIRHSRDSTALASPVPATPFGAYIPILRQLLRDLRWRAGTSLALAGWTPATRRIARHRTARRV